MRNRNPKDGGARGVLVLTVSNLLVKAAGLVFKIPMNSVVGDAGMGYYNAACSLFTVFYTLSAAGLPVALSVMIAGYRAEGNVLGARQTEKRAALLFLSLGLASSCLMFFCAGPLSGVIRSPGSRISVEAVAPALLFLCVSGALRGCFQGTGDMTPTAVSQLAEAVGKTAFGVAGAVWAVRRGYSASVAAAFAAMGLTVGSLVGTLCLLAVRLRRGEKIFRAGETRDQPVDPRVTLRRLFEIALPVTLSASVMSLSAVADTTSVQRILQAAGKSAEEAAAAYGNYTSLAVPLFNLPPALVYPAAYALVPAAAAAMAEGNRKKAAESVRRAAEYAAMIGIPSAFGLAALADPILCLLFRESSAHRAAPLLLLLAPAAFFVCLTAVTNAALQAVGGQRIALCTMTAGAAVKWVSAEILLRRCGIAGAPLSTFLSYLTISGLNLCFLPRRIGGFLPPAKRILAVLCSGALCGFAAERCRRTFFRFLPGDAATLCAIAAGGSVYLAALGLTGILRDYLPRRADHRKDHSNGTEYQGTEGKTARRKGARYGIGG